MIDQLQNLFTTNSLLKLTVRTKPTMNFLQGFQDKFRRDL
jgi:hypothetical protein